MLISSGFNLFQFHDLITIPAIWGLFFGYGLISSIVIDFIGKFIPHFYYGKQILLYFLFGYFPFLVLMPIEYVLVAGTVGAFFSLLFLLGKEKLKPFKWYSWIVFVVPLVCFVIMPLDHTSKVGWNEVTEVTSVEVEYEYFNGEHLIPIRGKKDERIYFDVEHHFSDGKSTGISLYDENEDHIGMNEEDNDVLSMDFEETTTKYIVVEAINGKQGQFQVKWWKEGEQNLKNDERAQEWNKGYVRLPSYE